jgi:hypothetical protein
VPQSRGVECKSQLPFAVFKLGGGMVGGGDVTRNGKQLLRLAIWTENRTDLDVPPLRRTGHRRRKALKVPHAARPCGLHCSLRVDITLTMPEIRPRTAF